MSIVGTRPPTLDEWNKYELHHRARLSIKPGIVRRIRKWSSSWWTTIIKSTTSVLLIEVVDCPIMGCNNCERKCLCPDIPQELYACIL